MAAEAYGDAGRMQGKVGVGAGALRARDQAKQGIVMHTLNHAAK
jgi:hypothetical protein